MEKKTLADYSQETKSSDAQIANRKVLYHLFNSRTIPDDQLIHSFGLFITPIPGKN